MTGTLLVMCSAAIQLVECLPENNANPINYLCVCPGCQPTEFCCPGPISKGCDCQTCVCGQPGSKSGRKKRSHAEGEIELTLLFYN